MSQDILGYNKANFIHRKKVAGSCPTLCDPMDCKPPGSSVHGDSPGKNPGVPCPPPGIFPPQGLNLVSCTAGRVFTVWANREAQGACLFCRGFSDPGMELGSQASQADSSSSYRSHWFQSRKKPLTRVPGIQPCWCSEWTRSRGLFQSSRAGEGCWRSESGLPAMRRGGAGKTEPQEHRGRPPSAPSAPGPAAPARSPTEAREDPPWGLQRTRSRLPAWSWTLAPRLPGGKSLLF